MSEALLIAIVLLWLVVIALAIAVFALARQIGVLYERVAPAGALMVNQQIKVGEPAPELALQSLDGARLQVGGASERSTLVFFVAPDCPVCKTLLPALRSAADAERRWLDIVLASDGPAIDAHRRFVEQYKLGRFPYVVSEILGRSYGIGKLPYGVLIDETGMVAAMGIVNSREHLDSLFNAKEQRVASIQDYLAEREPPPFDEVRVEKNL